MRQFSSGGFRIWNLSREAKLVYSGFGLFALAAMLVSMLFYEDLVGNGTAGVRAYYAGEARANADANSPPGGPKMELPDEPAPPKIVVAVSYRKLLEVTHFHLFTVPVFMLIVAHLFMLTGLGGSTKAAWIVAGWVAAFLHLAAPWIVRYGSAKLAWVYPASGGAMAVTMSVLTVYPMIVMWMRPADRER